MREDGPKRCSYRDELRRERLKKALLFWGAVLLVAMALAGWAVLQNMRIGSGRISGFDPTQKWHKGVDNPYANPNPN
jgi:hypothetical protein